MLANGQHIEQQHIVPLGSVTTVPRNIPPVRGVTIDWTPSQADRNGTLHHIPAQTTVDRINLIWRREHWSTVS